MRAVKLLVAVAATLMIAGGARAANVLTIRERVTLKSSVVRLGDVADIAASGGDEVGRLATLPLMPAPAPGTQRFLQRREITNLLAAHGVEASRVSFAGAEHVEISVERDDSKSGRSNSISQSARGVNRHAAILAGRGGDWTKPVSNNSTRNGAREQLTQSIIRYLTSKVNEVEAWRVKCELAERHLAVLERSISEPAVQGGSPPWTGRQRFVVTCSTAEGEVQLPVYAEVAATSAPVVVATQPIQRGEPITAAHVVIETVDDLPSGKGRRIPVTSIDDVIGMEARNTIRAGEVVFSDQVQPPVLVKRGELITISSHAGGIRVRTTARAKEDGTRGQLVQVESIDTREKFEAQVVGQREAAVFALTRPASTSSQAGVARRPALQRDHE